MFGVERLKICKNEVLEVVWNIEKPATKGKMAAADVVCDIVGVNRRKMFLRQSCLPRLIGKGIY